MANLLARLVMVKKPEATATGVGWTATRVNDVVELRINGLPASEGQQQLPSGFAPTAQTYVPVSAAAAEGNARVAIAPAGVITPQNFAGTAYGFTRYRTN